MSSPTSVLREYWPDLVYGLTDVEMIIDYLYRDRVITAETMEALHRDPDPAEKMRKLLSHVRKRSSSGAHTAFTNFLAALEESDNGHLAEQLREAARIGVPAHRPTLRRALSQPVPRPRVAKPACRKNSESAVTASESTTSSNSEVFSEGVTYSGSGDEREVALSNRGASRGLQAAAPTSPAVSTATERARTDAPESTSSSGSEVFKTGITYTSREDEREGSPPVSTPSVGLQSAAGTGARPKQRPPGTSERRKSTSASWSDVLPTGITHTSTEGSAPVSTPSVGLQSAAGTGARPKQHPPGTSERRKSTSASWSDVLPTGITHTSTEVEGNKPALLDFAHIQMDDSVTAQGQMVDITDWANQIQPGHTTQDQMPDPETAHDNQNALTENEPATPACAPMLSDPFLVTLQQMMDSVQGQMVDSVAAQGQTVDITDWANQIQPGHTTQDQIPDPETTHDNQNALTDLSGRYWVGSECGSPGTDDPMLAMLSYINSGPEALQDDDGMAELREKLRVSCIEEELKRSYEETYTQQTRPGPAPQQP